MARVDDVEEGRGWLWTCIRNDWKEGFIGRMFYVRGMMDEWGRIDGSLCEMNLRFDEMR